MAIVIPYSTRALDEIDEMAETLALYSPSYAKMFINAIFAKVELLRAFPHLGRQVPEIDDESIRKLLFKRYHISYQVESPYRIAILSVQSSTVPLRDINLKRSAR